MDWHRPARGRFSQKRLFYIFVGILLIHDNVDAVIFGGEEGCGGVLTGTSGNISSPGYPIQYPENVLCSWNITVSQEFRIEVEFVDFEIEAADGCIYDFVLLRDGLTLNSPVLGKVCHLNPEKIMSTGSDVLIQFYSDMSEVKRGFYMKWRTVPKVPLLQPKGMSVSSPWLAIPTPKNLAQIDGGISESLWGTDQSSNVYVYSNNKWDLVDGRMVYVTSGESVFGISSNGDVWYRQGVLLENPRGFAWEIIRISQPMTRVESGRKGVAIALNNQGSVYQLQMKDSGPTSVVWRLLASHSQDPLVDLSCGSYACWFVSKNGNAFIGKHIDIEQPKSVGSPDSVLQKVSDIRMKRVVAGFGASVWAITPFGQVYKRVGVSALSPEGSGWKLVENVKFKEITVGLTGVYGLTDNGILITVEELKCGGILHDQKGQFATPGYPNRYPRDLTCLWIVRVPDAKGIVLKFTGPVGIDKLPRCHDYIVTFRDGKYPSKSEPLIECGSAISDKYFNNNEIWIEFRSPGQDGGIGFRVTYSAWFDDYLVTPSPTGKIKTTIAKGTTTRTTPRTIASRKHRTSSNALLSSLANKDGPSPTNRTHKRTQLSSLSTLTPSTARSDLFSQNNRISTPSVRMMGELRSSVAQGKERTISSPKTMLKSTETTLIAPTSALKKSIEYSTVSPLLPSEKPTPQGWEVMKLMNKVLQVSSNVRGDTWALDDSGQPYVYSNGEWKPVSRTKLRNLAVGTTGVWGVTEQGNVLYRGGVTSQVKTGLNWITVDGTGNMKKVLVGPLNEVLGIRRDGSLVWRYGVSLKSPSGTEWIDLGKRVLDASVGSFGLWIIDQSGSLQFGLGKLDDNNRSPVFQWTQLYWKFAKIRAGYGDTLWGVLRDGRVAKRKNIHSLQPMGSDWEIVDNFASNDISPGLRYVYRTSPDGSLMRKKDTICGGVLSKIEGEFQTPNYPSHYPKNTYCLWTVRVPGAKRLQQVFTEFRIENSPTTHCTKDRVISYFTNPQKPSIECGRYFSNKQVDGDTFSVEFISDGDVEANGFHAKYKAYLEKDLKTTPSLTTGRKNRQCGGLLVSSSGVFSTPNFPNSYPNNSVCLWVIKVDKAKQIQVNIDQLDLASDKKDFLAFQEHGVPVTARRERPTLVTSSGRLDLTFAGNTALFEFISDGSIAAKGFIARYTTDRVKKATTTKLPTTTPRSVTTTSAQGCGGSIYRDSGELSSPNYPSNYGNSLNCKWIITAKPGKTIQVVFTDVSVEADGLCGYDYVEVGNGAVVGENSRKRLCGELRNQRFTSTANQIWIRFYTDSGVTKRGFKAHWSTGQLLPTTKKAPITRKPTTPSTIADDLPNGWRYVSTPSQSFKQVATGITDDIWALSTNGRPFILRKGTWIGVTDRPFKQITSGEAGTWAITDDDRAVYRDGSKWSQPGSTRFKMVDSGPHGFVLGVTNNNDLVYRDGISKQSPFGTAWKSLGKSFDSVSIGSYGIWGVDGIGDVYFVERPAKITAGIPLTWYRVPGLRLKQVDAGFGDNVYGVAQNGELYRRVGITHDKPQGDAWQRENANLKSVTTGLKGLFGIAGSDRIVQKINQPTQCGGILTAKSGEIKSPGFPFAYPQTAHCLWLIKVPSARSIRISIDSFNVNPSQGCKDDHVIFFKRGFYSPRDGVDKYCGRRTDFTRNQFDGGEVWVLFQASALDQRSSSGFQLRYSADIGDLTTRPTIPVTTTSTTMSTAPSTSLHTTPSASITGCGGSFSRNYGSFSSPGFPNLYQNSLRCIWTITVSPDRSIRLSFDDFAVEEDITCRFDFVKVKTSSQNGLDLGKFCGSTRPRDISVNGNKLWILFKSDTSEQKRGFRVTWSSKPRVDQIARSTTKPRTTSSHVKPRVSTTAKAIIKPTTAPQVPVGWSKIFSDIAFAHIDGGISPNAWAVNQRGDTFFQEGNNWRLVSGTPMKWVTSGESGVWAIDAAGNAYYRQGVAPLAPMGAYWDGVNGPKLTRIDSGPRGVLIAVDDGNYLLVREGISLRNPKGTSWRQIGTGYKHLSAGTYGLWAVALNNQAYFSTMSSVDPFARPRWTPVSGRFNQVKAGYGGSLWAVTPDGQLYRRKGVTAITPSGLDWEKIGNMKVNGVSSGMSGVFSTLRGTNELIKSPDRRCGDIMTKVGGTFTSPSYPLNYPPDTHCLWQIKVPGAKKIIVDFQGFELEGGGAGSGGAGSARRCNKDYLLYLQDSRYPSSYAVKKRCGFDASPIIFEGDKAWIEFVSDSSNSFSGFSARYQAVFSPIPPTDRPLTERVEPTTAFVTTPAIDPRVHTACDGTIDATVRSSGYFAHPGYPGTYKTYDVCRYVIKTSNNKKINLEFDLFDLEAGGQCVYDYLQIHDGNNRQGTLLGKFCGTTKPAAIKSTGDSLYVEFVSDSSTVRPGFLAKWSIIEDRIATTTKIPTTVTTTKKVPEGPTAGKIRTACGGNIDAKTKSSGLFAHPSYPSRYRNKVVCNYVIQTTPDKTISLTFDKLNLEPSISCQYDFIEVRDGKDLNGRLLGKFCGSRIPASVTSTRDYLYVRFFTDDTTGGEGFVATWKTDIGNTVATIPPSTVCGNVFTKSRGSFASPGYPQNYPPGKDCAWVITVAPGKVIQLSFDFFSIEPSDSCEYDFIEVFDGATDSAKRLGRYCSKMPGEILSSGSKMRIRLRTDTSKNYKGFVARWAAQDPPSAPTTMSHTTISKPCFQRISGIGGEIHRGGRFSYYQPNQDCVWIITVSEGKRVRLSFVFLDLEDSPYCSKDLLIILDGPSDISRAIGRYCGRKQIGDIVSSGNQVYLRFKSDSHNQRRGFQLRWSAANPVTLKPTPKPTPKPTTQPQRYGVDICTGVLSGQSGYIVSPNYPGNYPLDRSCRKTIRSPPGTRIVLSFPDFSLESSTNCFGDVLAILDGDAPSAPNLANLCGSNVVPEIKSTGNAVFIEFVSDYSRTDRGFRLHWKSELLPQTVAPTQQATRMPTTTQDAFPEAPDCGGKLFGSSGRLQSPQLSRRYPYGITCVWIIETGRSTAIDIRLGSFDTGSKDCTGSYLLLRDGMSSYGRKIAKLCNTDAGRRVTSAGNMMYIEYRMDPNFNGRGFDLTWNERTLDKSQAFRCGGIKTRASGSISHVARRGDLANDVFCTWNIVAPTGSKIRLNVARLELEDDIGCTRDSLVIRDGFSSESKLIGKYCGSKVLLPVTSTGNSLFIELKTDCRSSKGIAFVGSWQRVRGERVPVTVITSEITVPQKPTTSPHVIQTTVAAKTSTVKHEGANQGTQQPQPTIAESNLNSRGGLLTGISGVIRSPQFPNKYPANQDIVWVIKGPSNGRIALNFRRFDLEDDSGCRYDYVHLRDGSAADSPTIGRFCGNHIPATYTSANNALWVRFFADNSDSASGFEAVWRWIKDTNELPAQTVNILETKPVCGGTLNGKSGEISSPNYPQYYPANKECIWIIRPKEYSAISLQFKSMRMEPEARCGYDFVEVRNGDSSTSPLLGRFCGSSLPDVQTSTRGAFWVRFKSDSSSNYRGFSASWKAGISNSPRARRSINGNIDKPGCGQAFAGTNGTLALSPPTKGDWKPKPTSCQWTIKSHDHKTIALHIRELGFKGPDSCDKNYMDIRVEHGDEGKLELFTRLCPSDAPKWYNSLSIPTGSRRVVVDYALESRGLAREPLRVVWNTLDSESGIF